MGSAVLVRRDSGDEFATPAVHGFQETLTIARRRQVVSPKNVFSS